MGCIALLFCLLLMTLSCVKGLLNKIPSIGIRGGGLQRRLSVVRSQATVAPVIRESAKLYGAEELLAKTDIFIFDCDGVIW